MKLKYVLCVSWIKLTLSFHFIYTYIYILGFGPPPGYGSRGFKDLGMSSPINYQVWDPFDQFIIFISPQVSTFQSPFGWVHSWSVAPIHFAECSPHGTDATQVGPCVFNSDGPTVGPTAGKRGITGLYKYTYICMMRTVRFPCAQTDSKPNEIHSGSNQLFNIRSKSILTPNEPICPSCSSLHFYLDKRRRRRN